MRKGGSAAFVTSVQVAPGITAPTPAQEKIHFIKQLWRDRLKGVQRNVEVRGLKIGWVGWGATGRCSTLRIYFNQNSCGAIGRKGCSATWR